jgi:alpha-L-fucosidase 2
MVRKILILLFIAIAGMSKSYSQNNTLRLWYDRPAAVWEETLPLGNGRLGMMPDGGIQTEKIVLNEITLWSGAAQDANNYEANRHLPQIRSFLIQGKNEEAEKLINKAFVCKGEGSGRGEGANVPFGCYQVLGNLEIAFDDGNAKSAPAEASAYKRELMLNEALARTTYQLDDVTYTREYFTGFAGDVSVVRITADQKAKLTCRISLSRPERAVTSVDKNALQMTGQLTNGTDGKGMRYKVMVKPVIKGGTLTVNGQSLEINEASEIILYISAGTDFRDKAFETTTETLLTNAIKQSYTSLKRAHTINFQKLFSRVSLHLGGKDNDHLTTDKRLLAYYRDPDSDNGIPVLYFHYGRYLSISSTRVGLLPPNLQGLWANQVQTPWNGDYHLDVNVQMNHWLLEPCNLSELNLPLTDLVSSLVNPGQRTAKAYYNAEGWVAHVITNVWGYTEPGEEASWGSANSGSGWLCNNLWDHYTFTNDRSYLEKIYPILKGAAQFYNSVLMKDPKTGWLVTAPSVSPENGFILPNGHHINVCMGPTIDHQITRELFSNVIEAGKLLGVDRSFSDTLTLQISNLPPAGRIARDGRLMEWLEEYQEADPKHRHISHLYGLYPASLITPDRTPELAEACRKTLEARGDDSPGWSKAYKLLFWARLKDGERANKLLRELLYPAEGTDINYAGGGGVYPNMFSAGPPFQIDGNFGGAAGIAEMLIQSHDGYIELLPAIPFAWKASGKMTGMKARGNYTVDFEWKDGVVTKYRIASPRGGVLKVKVGGKYVAASVEKI